MSHARSVAIMAASALMLTGLSMASLALEQSAAGRAEDADVAPATATRAMPIIPPVRRSSTADAESTPGTTARPASLRRIHRVTAYCDRGTTAAGVPSGVGQCAAPADIPFGSKIYIPALKRTFVVTDRTHKRFRHNTVDIFMPSKRRCREFGVDYLECVIQLPKADGRQEVRQRFGK